MLRYPRSELSYVVGVSVLGTSGPKPNLPMAGSTEVRLRLERPVSMSRELSSRVGFLCFSVKAVTGAGSDSTPRSLDSSVLAFVLAVKVGDSTFSIAPRVGSVSSSLSGSGGTFGVVFPSSPTVGWTFDEGAYFSTRKHISS